MIMRNKGYPVLFAICCIFLIHSAIVLRAQPKPTPTPLPYLIARPMASPIPMATPITKELRTVLAITGDTVTTISQRNGVDPNEVARLNGLLPNSVLGAGRAIKIGGSAKPIQVRPRCSNLSVLQDDTAILPESYCGTNLVSIAEVIWNISHLEKDEFETTKQFEERKQNTWRESVLDRLTPTSKFALVIDGDYKYDADREVMVVGFDFTKNLPVSKSEFGTSLGTTNYFVKFSLKYGRHEGRWLEELPVNLGVARDFKYNLRLIALVRLNGVGRTSFVDCGQEYSYRSERCLSVSVEEIWLYDRKSGIVHRKYKDVFADASTFESKISTEHALLIKSAQKQFEMGAIDEAIATLRRVLASEPMSAESYLLFGKIHLRRGDIEQAISSFKTSVFWDNRLIDAHVSLGKIYVEKGDCLQAKNYAASAAEINPENQDAIALQRLSERCSK